MWVVHPSSSCDLLDIEFPFDESILEAMTMVDRPLEDMLHQLSFFSKLEQLVVDTKSLVSSRDIERYQCPKLTHDVSVVEKLVNISNNLPHDISMKLGPFKDFWDAFFGSSSEMSSFNLIVSRIYFLELTTKFSIPIHTKDQFLISLPCHNGHHQECNSSRDL